MPIAVPSATTAAAILPQTTAAATTRSSGADATDPFRTVLARTTADARSAAATRDVNTAAANADAAERLDQRRAEDAAEATDDASAEEVAAQLAAQQLVAQQLAAQLVTPNTPPVVDSTALPTGQLASDARNLTAPEVNANTPANPTQTNPLFRQAVAEAGQQNNTRLPGSVAQTNPPADAAPPPVPPAVAPTPTPEAQPQPAAANGLAAAVAAVQPGQRQVVTAQAPIVAGLLPNPTDTGATALPTTVTAPAAPLEAAGLPNVTIGDRPATAGEQFAAIASAAGTLVPTAAPVSTEFAQVLTTAAVTDATPASLLPTQLGTTDDRPTARDAADTAQPTALPPTFSTAPAPQSVTNAQTPTAVRTPDPVAQVADGIVTHAHVVARGGETEFRLRLDPPELGAVKVRLVADGDGIRGQVVVSNDAIRRMIESQLPELRQRLEQAGVAVQNFDVATDTNPGTGGGDGNWGGYRSEFPADAMRVPDRPGAARPRGRTAGAIDVMA